MSGAKLTAADGLSRCPCDPTINLEADEELQEDIAQLDPNIFESVSSGNTRAMRYNPRSLFFGYR